MAEDALGIYLYSLKKDGGPYPEPSDQTDIKAEGRDFVVLIEYDDICSYEVIRAFMCASHMRGNSQTAHENRKSHRFLGPAGVQFSLGPKIYDFLGFSIKAEVGIVKLKVANPVF